MPGRGSSVLRVWGSVVGLVCRTCVCGELGEIGRMAGDFPIALSSSSVVTEPPNFIETHGCQE